MDYHRCQLGGGGVRGGRGGGGVRGVDGSTDSCQSAGQPPVKDSRSNGFSLQLESAAAISCRLEVEGVSS